MTNTTWVVYLMSIHKQERLFPAVCQQWEWDALERARPAYHRLIRAGIATETEAEAMARHHVGDTPIPA